MALFCPRSMPGRIPGMSSRSRVATDHQTRPRVSDRTASPLPNTVTMPNNWNRWYATSGLSIRPSG